MGTVKYMDISDMTTFKITILGVLMYCTLGVSHAEAIAPDMLITNTVQEVTAIIKQDKDIQAGNQQKIIALVDAKVLPHFDFERMTRLAVGRYWRTATPAQRQTLVTEFRDMLVRTYTKVFTVYRDQTIAVKPPRMSPGDTEVTVNTTVSKPGSQTTRVDYEMKLEANGWKVFDISIEGVSMVMSYRGTFSSQIQQNGIDGLIKTLSNKNTDAVAADMVKAEAK